MKEAGVFEVIEVQGWEKKVSSKELESFKGRLDAPISEDYFLYTCAEERQTLEAVLKTRSGSYTLKKCFPFDQSFLHALETRHTRVGILYEQVIFWYKKHKPILNIETPLTYESQTDFAPAFLMLCRDLVTLHNLVEKHSLAETETPRTLQVSFERYVLPRIAQVFPAKGNWMSAFLNWEFGGRKRSSSERWSEDKLRSVPPEGRYLFMHQQAARRHAFLARDRDRDHRRSPATSRPQKSSEEHLKKAEQEARDAVQRLKKEQNLSEICLAGQNSYIRRAQHALIADLEGFGSSSVEKDGAKAVRVFVKN